MRKIAVILATLLVGAPSLFAQGPFDYSGRWNIAVQGGLSATVSDNVFGYTDTGTFKDLLKLQGQAAIGYDFTGSFGVRIAGGYSNHAGSSNIYDTYGKDIWPFTYKSIFGFADVIMNLNGVTGHFSPVAPKFYAGIGGAKTFGFTDPQHPWQNPPASSPTSASKLMATGTTASVRARLTRDFMVVTRASRSTLSQRSRLA